MPLTITALSVGRAFGLHRPAITYLRGWGKTIDIPLIMFVIEGGPDGPIVVDTGADPDRAEEFHKLRVEQSDEERPDAALRSLGVEPDEVRVVVNTHLHWDHSSNNHLFRNAEVIIQQREIDFARSPVAWHRRQFEALDGLEPAWMRAEHQIRPVDGDVTLAPGISVVTLPGHTPGSQGVLVDAASRRYLVAGDCVYLYENWEGDAEAKHIPVGFFTDLVAYERSLHRIEALDCEVIPSHDPRVLERRVFA
jgi:N-acyl homoserine lactone hydrolase